MSTPSARGNEGTAGHCTTAAAGCPSSDIAIARASSASSDSISIRGASPPLPCAASANAQPPCAHAGRCVSLSAHVLQPWCRATHSGHAAAGVCHVDRSDAKSSPMGAARRCIGDTDERAGAANRESRITRLQGLRNRLDGTSMARHGTHGKGGEGALLRHRSTYAARLGVHRHHSQRTRDPAASRQKRNKQTNNQACGRSNRRRTSDAARDTTLRAGGGLGGARCISLFRLCDSRYDVSCASVSDARSRFRAASTACAHACE